MAAAPGASRMPSKNFRRSRTKTYLTAIIESAETDEAGGVSANAWPKRIATNKRAPED